MIYMLLDKMDGNYLYLGSDDTTRNLMSSTID